MSPRTRPSRSTAGRWRAARWGGINWKPAESRDHWGHAARHAAEALRLEPDSPQYRAQLQEAEDGAAGRQAPVSQEKTLRPGLNLTWWQVAILISVLARIAMALARVNR